MSTVPPRPSPDAPDWEAIGRFLAGESPADEAAAVAAWLAAHPEDAALVDRVNAVADELGAQLSAPVDTEAALARVLARRDASATDAVREGDAEGAPPVVRAITSAPSAQARRGATRARRWWASPFAAAAALGLVAATAWWATTSGPASEPAKTPLVFATEVGARDSLTLIDGTTVVLGPASRLTVAAGYGADAREVELDGEGYFVVEHDDARPFTVQAQGARIVDLGTAFTVRAADDGEVTVAVTSGRVRLEGRRDATSALVLAAGDAAQLAANADAPVAIPLDTADAVAFTQGRLVLRDTPVRTLPALFRRWFGIVLTVDPALAERRVSATFAGEDAEAVVTTIALSLGARGSVRGDSAFLQRAETR